MSDLVHVFETAGLGKAPFHFARFEVRTYRACADAPVQPGTSCDYCGTGISNVYWIRSADGREFKVGCDCVEKTGDAGLRSQLKEHARQVRREKADAKRAAKRAEVAAVKAEMVARFCANRPGLAEALQADHYIVADIRERLSHYCFISEKQVALVMKLAREAKARSEEKTVRAPIADARQVVEGEILSVKAHESDFGTVIRMTVKVTTPEGYWLAWGTCPSSLDRAANLQRGDRVRFEAALKPGRDEHFAMFSRPTKAELTALAVTPERSARR